MSVFQAKNSITSVAVGAEAFGAGGNQPDTGPYRLRVLSVEDGKPMESGELSYKATWIVIAAPWNSAMVGRRITTFPTPPQVGKVKPFEGKTPEETLKIKEGLYKAMLISVFTADLDPEKDAEKIRAKRAEWNAKKGVNLPTGAEVYCKVKKDDAGKAYVSDEPREAFAFYEAFQGDGTNSNTTWMDPIEYAGVVARQITIKLRNEPAAQRHPTTQTGGGTGGARMAADPLADLDGGPSTEITAGNKPAQPPAGTGGGASAVASALDDL